VIATELGIALYRVDLSQIVSKWVGETEKNLARLFAEARHGHAVLLFDEADSLFGKRTEVKSANDRYANLEVNFLLQKLDHFDGIAILTTNALTGIDEAFLRRLQFRVDFDAPDADARVELWRRHLPAAEHLAGDVDLDDIAERWEFSGGNIRNAAIRAAFLAAEDNSAITTRTFARRHDRVRGAGARGQAVDRNRDRNRDRDRDRDRDRNRDRDRDRDRGRNRNRNRGRGRGRNRDRDPSVPT
jgi:SpoVK/Ycf46/Vps4 family AAA+-type ATPase